MRRPNFLIIMSDQHHPGVMGCAGDPIVRTPNLDYLADGGTRFTNAYCPSPLCGPSRMAFLASQYCGHTDVWSNDCLLDSTVPTWPRQLANAGYDSVLCGRMHLLGPDRTMGFGKRIFGEVEDALNAEGKPAVRLGRLSPFCAGQSNIPVAASGPGTTGYIEVDRQATERACQYLREYPQDSEQPFALVLGLLTPHNPYVCPKPLFDYYYDRVQPPVLGDAERSTLHPAIVAYRQARQFDAITPIQARSARAAYYGLVELMDSMVGQVLETLGETRLADNTIILYTSDHGETLGEHGIWTKSNFYEASAGVPMIWNLPAGSKSAVNSIVNLIDIGPTVLELANIPAMPGCDGRSFSRLLNHEDPSWINETFSDYGGLRGDRPSRMLRSGKYKLIHYHGYQHPQLFNLETDPGEKHDLASDPDYAEILEKLLPRLLADWDGDEVEQKMLHSNERHVEAWEKAQPHRSTEDFSWVLPEVANELLFEPPEFTLAANLHVNKDSTSGA